jgi:NAD(P)-dependent dehydrogenase (short-subunit alcohol dehydrogenase family)
MDLNQSADTVTDDMWDRCIAINLTAPVKLIREVIPIMRQKGKGSIVNVGSKASMSGAVSGVAYTASTLHLSQAIHLSSHSHQNINR